MFCVKQPIHYSVHDLYSCCVESNNKHLLCKIPWTFPVASCTWISLLCCFSRTYTLHMHMVKWHIVLLCSVDHSSRYNSFKLRTWRTILFSYMFIPNLYMFWTLTCSSSGELIVLIWRLVYVTLCRWPSDTSHLRRVTYTRGRIDTINSRNGEHMSAWNM
jgi:hypothetical protein